MRVYYKKIWTVADCRLFSKYLTGILITLLVVCGCPGLAGGVIIDRVVAVVNGEIISLSDVVKQEQLMKRQAVSGIPQQTPALNKELLEKLIGRKLMLQQAKEKDIKLPEEQLKAALNDVVSQYGAQNIEQLAAALLEQGSTLEELKAEIESQIKITKLINTEVRSKILITQAEIEQYYEQHRQDYEQVDEISARHIILPLTADATAEDELKIKQHAEEIVSQLRQGADFNELFEKISGVTGQSSANLDHVKRGELMPELEQAIWDLKPEELGIVKTSLGYHVVQVVERKLHTLEDDAQIKQQIENILFRQKVNQRSQAWLDNLRSRATIEIMP
jgi:peptidyl-prolyl cis-trans isomerase SurA